MTYHSQKRKTPLVLYNALNLYGLFRSKCIINIHLHMGLSVPYMRILKITKQTADAMLHQFKYLKLFLRFLRFFNTRLSTATMDYNRTDFSLI